MLAEDSEEAVYRSQGTDRVGVGILERARRVVKRSIGAGVLESSQSLWFMRKLRQVSESGAAVIQLELGDEANQLRGQQMRRT